MPLKSKRINTFIVIGGKLHAKESQLFYDLSGVQKQFGAVWQTMLINGTLIAVHESTSQNNRKKRTVESRYIFIDQSPSINHYTKVIILPLSQLKAIWVDLKSPAPSSSMTTAMVTAMAPALSSKTIVLILAISTETTAKDTMTTPEPTAKMMSTIGD